MTFHNFQFGFEDCSEQCSRYLADPAAVILYRTAHFVSVRFHIAVFGSERLDALLYRELFSREKHRAVYLATSMGMHVYGITADRRTYQRILYYEARESLARVKAIIYAAIKPEPTYLGKKIPLTGDGRITAKATYPLLSAHEG